MGAECCVVVPVYKNSLEDTEHVALRNNRSVLAAHPFVAIAPQGIDISAVTSHFEFQDIKRFDASYFQSPQTYSNLLVINEFWSEFSDYRHMLITQLDVVVFRDEVTYWCEKNYDYIGAPWLNGFGSNNILSQQNIKTLFRRSESEAAALYEFFRNHNIVNELGLFQPDYWKANVELLPSPIQGVTAVELAAALDDIEFAYHSFAGVGNGGFSLRSIEAARRVLESRLIPHQFALATRAVEQYPLMARDLNRLKELCGLIHKLNAKVVASLKELARDTDYLETILDLAGQYTPERSTLVLRIRDSIRALTKHHPELVAVTERLDHMKDDALPLFLKGMTIPEDFFWAQIAPLFVSDFKVAPVEDALRFGFECNPRFCYRANGQQLPFGCHAWHLPQNREFWDEVIPFLSG